MQQWARCGLDWRSGVRTVGDWTMLEATCRREAVSRSDEQLSLVTDCSARS